MRITATRVYFDEKGTPTETHQLIAEFDGEFELPGMESQATVAVAGRAMEIGSVGRALVNALREEIE